MSDDQMLICLIAFVLGWIVSRHMGNGFSVGGERNRYGLPYCTGVKSQHNDCNKITFNNDDLWDSNVNNPGDGATSYYDDNYIWGDYLNDVYGKGHFIYDTSNDEYYQCDRPVEGDYTARYGKTTLTTGNTCYHSPEEANPSEYCTGKNIGSLYVDGASCDTHHLKYEFPKVKNLLDKSNAYKINEPGEYARKVYGTAWYQYEIDPNTGKAKYSQCNATPDAEDYWDTSHTIPKSKTRYKLQPNSKSCKLRPKT